MNLEHTYVEVALYNFKRRHRSFNYERTMWWALIHCSISRRNLI
jgi:hypothetical protein